VAFASVSDTETETELSVPTLPGLGSGCLPVHGKRDYRRKVWKHQLRRPVTGFRGQCTSEASCPNGRQVHGYCAGIGTVCCKNANGVTTPVKPATPTTPAAPAVHVLKAGTSTCASKGGVCQDKSSCKTTPQGGMCPGAANIMCCFAGTAASSTPTPAPAAPTATGVAAIEQIVDASTCSTRSWTGRGKAPKQYVRGLAVSFAKAVCQPTREDVVFVGNANPGSNDVMNWYGSIIKSALGATTTGITTVRQIYTVMIGLGMRESSGVWCTGRDMSSGFSSAATAESGLFQTSYGAHTRSVLMDHLMSKYQSSKAGCASSVYSPGITCSATNMKNWGATTDMGFQWQALTKQCPSFSAEYAAVLLRLNGGSKGEWGPLRTKAAEVVPACYSMLGSVQSYVEANSATLCNTLLNLA